MPNNFAPAHMGHGPAAHHGRLSRYCSTVIQFMSGYSSVASTPLEEDAPLVVVFAVSFASPATSVACTTASWKLRGNWDSAHTRNSLWLHRFLIWRSMEDSVFLKATLLVIHWGRPLSWCRHRVLVHSYNLLIAIMVWKRNPLIETWETWWVWVVR